MAQLHFFRYISSLFHVKYFVINHQNVMALSCQTSWVLFTMQFLMSFMGLSFSMMMTVSTKRYDIYLPVMTSIVGYWLPSPMLLVNSPYGKNTHNFIFITQATMSMCALIFCGSVLYLGEQTEIFLPIMTGVMAYWLPCPTLTNPVRLGLDADDLNAALLNLT